MILVHARAARESFVRAGEGLARHDFYNDFVIVGPPGDPAGVRGLQDAGKAFARIAGASSIVATHEFQTIAFV